MKKFLLFLYEIVRPLVEYIAMFVLTMASLIFVFTGFGLAVVISDLAAEDGQLTWLSYCIIFVDTILFSLMIYSSIYSAYEKIYCQSNDNEQDY